MKRKRERRSEEKVGGKGSNEDSELKTNQKEHAFMNPILSPVSPVSSSMSPVSSTGDQVQARLPSSPSSQQSGYFHYGIGEMYFMYKDVLVSSDMVVPQIYVSRINSMPVNAIQL